MIAKSQLLVGGIFAIMLLVLSGCGGDKPADQMENKHDDSEEVAMEETMEKDTSPIKIGISGPFTGEAASFGEGMKGGVEVAVKEINENGGVNGRMIEVIYEDDKCNNKDGSSALNKLANVDKVDAIVGPVCSAAAGAGLPAVQKTGIPSLVIGSAPHLPSIGDYIFRNYPSDSFQGKFAAELAYNKLEKRKAAVLYVKNDWGQGIMDVFSKTFKDLGGEIVFEEGVAQDVKDLRSIITKLKATEPDLIYFPAYPAVGIIGLKQISDLGIDLPILGGDAFDTAEVIESGSANGVMYTTALISNPEEFKTKIKEQTNVDSNIVTPIAYDNIKILAQVFKKVGTDKEKVRDELMNVHYTDGISLPSIEFDQDGDLKEAIFNVNVVKDNKSEKMEI